LERGLDGLLPRRAQGAPGKIPTEMADEIKRWVIEGPAQQGLDRANWTHQELADHLHKTHGIKTSRSAVHRLCSRIDIRPYRPTYRFLRGDTVKQAQAKADIAEHLRHIGRVYARERFLRVVLLIDNAPWHRGPLINAALAANPHLEFKRLPSYSPQLNPIERFWKVLRRRATHNRLFDTIRDLKKSVRASLSYFQTVRQRVLTLIQGRRKKSAT